MNWWPFKKKSPELLPQLSCLELGTDMHAHWLPGIDDGAKDLEESLALIDFLIDLGFTRLIATPHVMSDFYINPTDKIRKKLDDVREMLHKNQRNIELSAAAEYYFDEELIKRLGNKDLLTLGNTNYVLFELSYINEPNNLKEVLGDLFQAGYTPLLAHPERYPFYAAEPEKYLELAAMGVQFQVNLMSLCGYYGAAAYAMSKYLIAQEQVSFIATDIHKIAHFEPINKALCTPEIHELITKVRNNSLHI